MAVVDCPPGLSLSSLARYEFVAKAYAKNLARAVFLGVVVVSVITVYFIGKNFTLDRASVVLAGPLFCFLIASLGIVVRSARLRFFEDRVQWSVPYVQFSMPADKLSEVLIYKKSLAFVAKKGSSWFVTERDWNDFSSMQDALESCNYPIAVKSSEKTPLKASLQSYGHVLDALLVLNLLASVGLLWFAMNSSKN